MPRSRPVPPLLAALILLSLVARLDAATPGRSGSGKRTPSFAIGRNTSPKLAFALFKYSISYLALLFAAVAADRLIPLAA